MEDSQNKLGIEGLKDISDLFGGVPKPQGEEKKSAEKAKVELQIPLPEPAKVELKLPLEPT